MIYLLTGNEDIIFIMDIWMKSHGDHRNEDIYWICINASYIYRCV